MSNRDSKNQRLNHSAMRPFASDNLKASAGPVDRSPSLTRTSSATPGDSTFPWVMSPQQQLGYAPVTAGPPNANATANTRFVAGEAFFNYGEFGSLRPGQEPIQLASVEHFGFAVHALVCGFAFTFFSYGYGRLLADYLKANDEQQVKAANYMLIWPSTLSIFIGLVSDAFPIAGYRRKGYMVLGWVLTIAMCVALFVLDKASDSAKQRRAADPSTSTISTSSPYVSAYLVVSLLAGIGIQISWVAAIAASIEYAQREHIHRRGSHHATLLTLYYGGSACAMLLTWFVIGGGPSSTRVASSISIGETAMIVAGVSLAVIPCIVFGYHEPRVNRPIHLGMTVAQRLHVFWRLCHQNIVYRVLLFVIFHLFLLAFYDQNVRDAVQSWSGVDWKDALVVDVARNVAMVVGLLVWKFFLRNVGWRKIVVFGSMLFIAGFIALTTLTTYDIVRSKWFYGAMFTVIDIPRAWLLLFVVHFSGEIADVGHEGVTVGLALSYQRLVALASVSIASMFPDVVGYRVSSADILLDSSDARSSILTAFFITVGVNVLCFPVIKLLPQQKLDAQQLRAFGGYNKVAGLALLVTLFVLVGFNLAVNLVTVL